MAVVESSNAVDTAACAGPSTGSGGGAADPSSPKDLASAFAVKYQLAQGPARDSPSAAAAPGAQDEGFKREMRDLEELLSKLNPMAEEFVPLSLAGMRNRYDARGGGGFYYVNGFGVSNGVENGGAFENGGRRKKNGYGQGKRRMNSRTCLAQREEMIRRTVYVSDIDHQMRFPELSSHGLRPPTKEGCGTVHTTSNALCVYTMGARVVPAESSASNVCDVCPTCRKGVTEEQLATLFINCGQVVDCRMCGDPSSVLRFAFIEFTDEEGARAAFNLSGTVLGYYPVRVLPSKTAIAPVNPTFLPRSDNEREMCSRTVYCTNIDKKVSQADLKLLFESICGEVYRLRLLGDYHHSTRIAFVEFVMAESATAALNCSGVVLGSLPIRVSPSKTPVRPRAPRPPMH